LKGHFYDPNDLYDLYGVTLQLPNSITFGGPDLKTAYVTSAVNKVMSFTPRIAGAKKVHWDLWNSKNLFENIQKYEEPKEEIKEDTVTKVTSDIPKLEEKTTPSQFHMWQFGTHTQNKKLSCQKHRSRA
jgi:hypothetical protein